MKKVVRSWDVFPIKPAVSAIALMCGGAVYAEEPALVLPEIQVEQQRESVGYNAPKSASQKFTAPLIDTPKSVSIITEQVIQDTGSRTFQDALRTTPGITFGAGEGGIAVGDRPYIRGFEAFGSIYVDGLRDLGSQAREVFAVEQMEVIKGPSGAFDGRGSAGGSINIVTKQAKEGNAISGSVGIGTDSYKRATVDGNFMLGENAAFRLVGMVHEADTPGRDNVDVERWGVMPSITLGLDTPTQFTASWYHLETDDVSDWGIPYFQPGGFPEGKPISVSKDNWYGIDGRDYQESSADIGTFKIEHAFNDNVSLRNTTRFGRTTNEYVASRPNVNTLAQLQNNIVTRTQRARDAETESLANLTDLTIKFNTGTVKHTVNAGFEISREENTTYLFNSTNGINSNVVTLPNANAANPNSNVAAPDAIRNGFPSREVKTTNRSFYVFDTMDLTESWILNAGVRHDSYKTELQNQNSATGAVVTEFENDESFMNYQLGVVYKMMPNANIYANYATSTSPVGLNMGEFDYAGGQLTAGTENLSPERSKTFEIGTKWNVLEDLSLNAAVFHTQKKNARVQTDAATFANSGEVEVNGFEIDAVGKITSKWNVFAGYTYLDAEQTKAGDFGDNNVAGGPASQGKQMYGVAKNSASIWTTHDILPKVTVGGGAFYVDKIYADPANNAYIPSYVRWDAMAKYKIDKNMDVQLNIQNLTDERYYSATYFRHNAIVAPGRSGFLTLNLKY